VRLSLGRAGMLALVLGLVGGAGTSACANAEDSPYTPPPLDTGDASLPSNDDAAPPPDASADAGPKVCSDHGFCHTSLPGDHMLQGVWGDGTGVVWAVTADGDILRWDGNAWKVHASNLGRLDTIWGSGPTDVWVGGENGIQHGSGASSAALTFVSSAMPASRPRIASIWGTSANDIWAVGVVDNPDAEESVGCVLHFTGGASSPSAWEIDSSAPQTAAYSNVWGGAGSDVWFAATRPFEDNPFYSELVIFRKSGGAFAELALPGDPLDDSLEAKPAWFAGAVASSASSMRIYGRTVRGSPTVWQGTSTDNGTTFSFTTAYEFELGELPINVVSGTAANDLWAAGEYGQVRHWNGTTWSPAAIGIGKHPVIDAFHGIWAGSSSEMWIVGEGIALRYDPTKVKDGGVK
jgi:hypothetical protein